jgi:hypothetical protein
MNILDRISFNQFYIDSLKQAEPLDLISPVISVLTKHKYSTSGILKVINLNASSDTNEEKLSEVVEKEIDTKGIKLLERFVDINELKKRIKLFKDTVSSFVPANYTNELINQLENSLLFFISVLKSKNYFSTCLPEILDTLKTLIKKEITFIETFKKDKNNEKNPKYNDIIEASSKRLEIQLGILKLINDNCCKNYSDATKEEERIPYANVLKEINNTITEFFDKSSDINNLSDLVNHLHKNLDFLIENEQSINANPTAVKKTSNIFSADKKFDNVKFEDSLVEKDINSLINLLRKNNSEEDLCEDIISAFITLVKKKKDTCNFLVKAGCPRLLLQIVENTSNSKLVAKALELIKYVTLSSPENLEMVSNQSKLNIKLDILEKLNDTFVKFPNDNVIKTLSNSIMNELVKLPGQEKSINEIINNNIKEITEILNNGKYEEQKGLILSDLERINAFTSNSKQTSLMVDTGFPKTLNQLVELTLKDQDGSNVNENLITNEMSLLKKITDEIKDNLSPTLGEILANIIKIIHEKSQYRDLFLNALKSLAGFIPNQEVFETHLKDKLDTKFIDQLFDIQENYIDDLEVGKEINNILCNLCLKSDALAGQISK